MTRSAVRERAVGPERTPAERLDRRTHAADRILQLQRTAGNQATSRLLATATDDKAGQIIVGDDRTPSLGQIRHAEMLAALRTRVLAIADEVLGRVGQDAGACIYLGPAFALYAKKGPAFLEEAIERFAPGALRAGDPKAAVEAVAARAKAAFEAFVQQGSFRGVPEEVREAVHGSKAEPAAIPAPATAQDLTPATQPALQTCDCAPVTSYSRLDDALEVTIALPERGDAMPQRDPDSEFADALKQANWPHAAALLNGFKREDILSRLKACSVPQIRLLHQGAVANANVGPQSQVALLTPELLSDFADVFRASAELIRLSPEALKLVAEAEEAKAKFGGYSEEGPGEDAWPYTSGDTVYVPKAHTDNVTAMSDFLFELNNAIRSEAFAQIDLDADAKSIDAKEYARRYTAQEVEGVLRLGEIWFEAKQSMGGGADLDAYDQANYQTQYQAFKSGTKSKDDILLDVLQFVVGDGNDAGKTHEQSYIDQYESEYGDKAEVKSALPEQGDAMPLRDSDSEFADAVKQANWPHAAALLNGFKREDILSRLKACSVPQIRLLHQGAVANANIGPQSQVALLTPELLSDFAELFRGSAELIRLSPEALKLVGEAQQAKAKFGGFAEDGPAKDPWPYTVGDTVYVPKAHKDNVVAMSDFLFELTNAINSPALTQIEVNAEAKSINAKQYAHDYTAQQVEGMLRLGEVWFETKQSMGGGAELDAYDKANYLTEYQAFKRGAKSKDDVLADVLTYVVPEGKDQGKTHEQQYMDQYEEEYGKKGEAK